MCSSLPSSSYYGAESPAEDSECDLDDEELARRLQSEEHQQLHKLQQQPGDAFLNFDFADEQEELDYDQLGYEVSPFIDRWARLCVSDRVLCQNSAPAQVPALVCGELQDCISQLTWSLHSASLAYMTIGAACKVHSCSPYS